MQTPDGQNRALATLALGQFLRALAASTLNDGTDIAYNLPTISRHDGTYECRYAVEGVYAAMNWTVSIGSTGASFWTANSTHLNGDAVSVARALIAWLLAAPKELEATDASSR